MLEEMIPQCKNNPFIKYSSDLLCLLNESFAFVWVNTRYSELLGLSPEDLLGLPFLNFVYGEYDLDINAIFDKTNDLDEVVQFELPLCSKNGMPVWFAWSISRIGTAISVVGTDISWKHDNAKTEELIQKIVTFESFYKETQEIAHLGSIKIDVTHDHVLLSDECYKVFDFLKESKHLSLHDFIKLIPLPERREFNEMLFKGIKNKQTFRFSHPLKKNGKTLYLEYRLEPMVYLNKRVEFIGTIQDITDFTTLKQCLEEDNKKLSLYHQIFEATSEIMLLVNPENGVILDANTKALQRLEFTKEELIQLKISDIRKPLNEKKEGQWVQWESVATKVLTEGQSFGYGVLTTKSQKSFPVETIATMVCYNTEKYVVTFSRDITTRLESEKRIKESEKRFKNLVSSINAIGWSYDLAEDRFTYVSDYAEKLLGYRVEEWATLDDWYKMIHPDERDNTLNTTLELTKKGKDHNLCYRMLCKDNTEIWVQDLVSVETDASEQPIRLSGVIIDITEEKEAMHKINTLHQILSIAKESAGIGIWQYDFQSNTMECDTQMHLICKVDETVAPNFDLFYSKLHHDDATRVKEKFTKLIEKQETIFHEQYRIVHSDASVTYIEASAKVLFDEDEQPLKMIGTHIDITPYKSLEHELANERLHLKRAQEVAHIGHWSLDVKTMAFHVSEEVQNMLGLDKSQPVIFDTYISLSHPDDKERAYNAFFEQLSKQEDYEIEQKMLTTKGDQIYVKAICNFTVHDNDVIGAFGTISDITPLKEAQLELERLNYDLQEEVNRKFWELKSKDDILQRQSKLALMGEMINAISHQWKQPLNALMIRTQILEEDFFENMVDESYIKEYIHDNVEIINFMAATVNDFRNFFLPQKEKSNFSVKEAIENTLVILEKQLHSRDRKSVV